MTNQFALVEEPTLIDGKWETLNYMQSDCQTNYRFLFCELKTGVIPISFFSLFSLLISLFILFSNKFISHKWQPNVKGRRFPARVITRYSLTVLDL